MPKKEKQVNVRLSEEQHTEIEEKAKKAKFATTSEYIRYAATNCWPNLCRSYLFTVAIGEEDDMYLTSLIRDVKIDYDSVTITFLLDEQNAWKKFIYSQKNFKIWWLTKKGERVDYFLFEHYRYPTTKIFPLHFGQDGSDVLPLGMAVFKP